MDHIETGAKGHGAGELIYLEQLSGSVINNTMLGYTHAMADQVSRRRSVY